MFSDGIVGLGHADDLPARRQPWYAAVYRFQGIHADAGTDLAPLPTSILPRILAPALIKARCKRDFRDGGRLSALLVPPSVTVVDRLCHPDHRRFAGRRSHAS